MVLPDELVRPVECLAQSLYISAPFLSQIAAVKAFDATDELEEIKAGYKQNRRLLLAGLNDIGFQDIHPVDGAFYAYADASRFTNDAVGFSKKLLDNTGVAATPGLDFDPINGHTMMRFSFAGSQQTVEKAIAVMASYLGQQ